MTKRFTTRALLLLLWGVLLMHAATIDATDPHLRHRKLKKSPKDVLPGQFIVEFYPEYTPQTETAAVLSAVATANVAATANSATASSSSWTAPDTKVLYYYDNVMNGVAIANYPEDQLLTLLNNPNVKAVWRVRCSGFHAITFDRVGVNCDLCLLYVVRNFCEWICLLILWCL
jgi:hypothetical protein